MSKIMKKFHPGYYIREVYEEYGMTQHEFARRLDMDDKRLSTLMNEKTNLTVSDAIKLSKLLDTSVEMWLNLQNSYDLYLEQIKLEEKSKKEKELFKLIDSRFLKTMIQGTENQIDKLIKELFVSSLTSLLQVDFFTFCRNTNHELKEETIFLKNVWTAFILSKARKKEVKEFDEKRLKSYLSRLKSLTNEELNLTTIETILNDSGVNFVYLPYLPKSNIYGLTRWMDSSHVVLGINSRGKTEDKFWFTLFHEIGHVLQKSRREMLVTDDSVEVEADEFASNLLIPKKEYEIFKKEKINKSSIINFSRKIEIHPGIVVGRLQHDRIIDFNQFNDLKKKIKES